MIYTVSNSITNIDCLQHANFPCLERLYLSNNDIVDMDVLSRMHMPRVRYLNIRKIFNHEDNNCITEVVWTLMRLQNLPCL
jgi:hypothetical protein